MVGEGGRERSGFSLAGAVVLGLAAAAYVVLRLQLGEEYDGASWKALVQMRAPLPYGHRVLVPLLVRPLASAGLSLTVALGVVEWVAVVGLIVTLRRGLQPMMPASAAWVFGFAILFVLPYAYLLQHRWPIFYPWDTPAMLFTAWAVELSLRRRMGALVLLTVVAALNRETAALVPIIALAVGLGTSVDVRRLLAWCGLMLVAYVLVRQSIVVALPDNPGAPIRWVVEGRYRILSNLRWLYDPAIALRFVASLGLLPLLWLLLRRDVPLSLQRLHIPALGFGCALLFVANAYEPRAFGEVIILCWLPIAAGTWRRMTAGERVERNRAPWLRLTDRYAAVVIIVAAVGAAFVFSRMPPPA